ncbi:hypothetical protein EsH8_I_000163 [Colletotrichum jinshuiense]
MRHHNGNNRREDSLAQPINTQYGFSRAVPTGQGITAGIRLLGISNDILVTVHGNHDVLVWSLVLNIPPQRLEIDVAIDQITGIGASSTSSNIIALSFRVGAAHEVWIFDRIGRTGQAIFTTGLDLRSVQFSPDDRLLAWVSAGAIDVWERITSTHIVTMRENMQQRDGLPTSAFAFTPDSSRIAAMDRTGRLTSWDVASCSYEGESEANVAWNDNGREAVQLVADGKRVMAVSRQMESLLGWRLTTWWPESGARAELDLDGCVYGCVPRDGGFVATVQADGGRLRIRDTGNGACLNQSVQGIAKIGKTPLMVVGAMATDGKTMVTQIASGRTTVWRLVAVG